jgi:hypothetical protein
MAEVCLVTKFKPTGHFARTDRWFTMACVLDVVYEADARECIARTRSPLVESTEFVDIDHQELMMMNLDQLEQKLLVRATALAAPEKRAEAISRGDAAALAVCDDAAATVAAIAAATAARAAKTTPTKPAAEPDQDKNKDLARQKFLEGAGAAAAAADAATVAAMAATAAAHAATSAAITAVKASDNITKSAPVMKIPSTLPPLPPLTQKGALAIAAASPFSTQHKAPITSWRALAAASVEEQEDPRNYQRISEAKKGEEERKRAIAAAVVKTKRRKTREPEREKWI